MIFQYTFFVIRDNHIIDQQLLILVKGCRDQYSVNISTDNGGYPLVMFSTLLFKMARDSS